MVLITKKPNIIYLDCVESQNIFSNVHRNFANSAKTKIFLHNFTSSHLIHILWARFPLYLDLRTSNIFFQILALVSEKM